jgi:broad specificity phosphatase PhoE
VGTFDVVAEEALGDVYVRHAMPLLHPDQPPSAWDLGPAGRAAARELAASMEIEGRVAVVVSSTEPKALSTATPIGERFGLDVWPDDRLVEAGRPWVGSPLDYRTLAHRFLAGEQPAGWEARERVVERVAAAVREAREKAGDEVVVVVGHGLSLCVHLGALLPRGFDPGGLWARLSFPDAWTVDRGDLLLSRCRR